MGTRAQFTIEDETGGIYPITVYKHSDGYPDGEYGVLKFLRAFTVEFFKFRGHDPGYFMAQLLRHWAASDLAKGLTLGGIEREYAEKSPYAAGYKQGEYLSWSVETQIHCDVEYLYHVTKHGTIEVRQPDNDASDPADWSASHALYIMPRVAFVWALDKAKPSTPRKKRSGLKRAPSSDLA